MIILQIFGIAVVTIFGFIIADLLMPNNDLLERIALGFLLGFGIFTLVMFMMNWKFGIVLNLESSSIILLVLIVISFCINSISKAKDGKNILNYKISFKFNFRDLSGIEIAMISVIVFIVLSCFLYNFFWPVRSWDALTLYDFRAKIIYSTGRINSILIDPYYLTYPLNTSLSHFWIYLLDIQNPMFIYSFFYFSLSICFYKTLRRFCSCTISLIFLFLLDINTLLFQHSILAYTNLPYTIYFSLGVIYIYQFVLQKRFNFAGLILSALLIGLSSWTRYTEPFWLLPIIIIIPLAFQYKKYLFPVVYGLVIYTFRYPWSLFLKSNFYEVTSVENSTNNILVEINKMIAGINIHSLSELTNYIVKNSITQNILLWMAFLLSALLVYRINEKNRPNQIIPLFIICGIMFMIIAGAYLYYLTGVYGDWIQLGDSISRISMVFVPLMLFFIGINLAYFLKSNKLHE